MDPNNRSSLTGRSNPVGDNSDEQRISDPRQLESSFVQHPRITSTEGYPRRPLLQSSEGEDRNRQSTQPRFIPERFRGNTSLSTSHNSGSCLSRAILPQANTELVDQSQYYSQPRGPTSLPPFESISNFRFPFGMIQPPLNPLPFYEVPTHIRMQNYLNQPPAGTTTSRFTRHSNYLGPRGTLQFPNDQFRSNAPQPPPPVSMNMTASTRTNRNEFVQRTRTDCNIFTDPMQIDTSQLNANHRIQNYSSQDVTVPTMTPALPRNDEYPERDGILQTSIVPFSRLLNNSSQSNAFDVDTSSNSHLYDVPNTTSIYYNMPMCQLFNALDDSLQSNASNANTTIPDLLALPAAVSTYRNQILPSSTPAPPFNPSQRIGETISTAFHNNIGGNNYCDQSLVQKTESRLFEQEQGPQNVRLSPSPTVPTDPSQRIFVAFENEYTKPWTQEVDEKIKNLWKPPEMQTMAPRPLHERDTHENNQLLSCSKAPPTTSLLNETQVDAQLCDSRGDKYWSGLQETMKRPLVEEDPLESEKIVPIISEPEAASDSALRDLKYTNITFFDNQGIGNEVLSQLQMTPRQHEIECRARAHINQSFPSSESSPIPSQTNETQIDALQGNNCGRSLRNESRVQTKSPELHEEREPIESRQLSTSNAPAIPSQSLKQVDSEPENNNQLTEFTTIRRPPENKEPAASVQLLPNVDCTEPAHKNKSYAEIAKTSRNTKGRNKDGQQNISETTPNAEGNRQPQASSSLQGIFLGPLSRKCAANFQLNETESPKRPINTESLGDGWKPPFTQVVPSQTSEAQVMTEDQVAPSLEGAMSSLSLKAEQGNIAEASTSEPCEEGDEESRMMTQQDSDDALRDPPPKKQNKRKHKASKQKQKGRKNR